MPISRLRNAVLAASLVPAGVSMPVLAQSGAVKLEEIIVSAQRREQSLQDVPISIAAFDNVAIDKFRIKNLLDLGTMVPNLSAVEGSGGTRSIKYQIRGLEAAGTALGADAGVATYIDGVYIKGGGASIVSYADIERIEVLRGPQGTLFGRNTSGGAIHFITRNPPGEFGFKQTLTAGNYDHFESKTRIDTPKWGPISATLTYTHSEREGPVDNTGAGATYDLRPYGGSIETSPGTLGDDRTEAVFLAVDFDLHEDLDLVYKYDYTDVDATPPAVGIMAGDPNTFGPALPFIISPSFGKELPDEVNNAFHLNSFQRNEGHNLTATFSLTEEVTLKNIFSYRENEVGIPGHTLDGVGQFAPAVIIFAVTGAKENRTISEEFQVIWDNNQFTWTSGFLYWDSDGTAGGYERVRNGIFGGQGLASFFPNFPGAGPIFDAQSDVEVESRALYSQMEYHLNERWDIILGGRYTDDEKDYVDRTLLLPTGQVIETTFDEEETTYLVGFNYRPTSDILLYAKYSTGYISGGIVSSVPYESEEADSLEVGTKTTLLDGKLQANLALFDVEYENQQFGTAGNLVDPPVPAPQVLVNAGKTSAKGAEMELNWLPFPRTKLGANVGYLDFEFEDIDFQLLGGPISPHLRPDWTGLLTADYETRPLFDNAYILFHVDASYRSDEWIATRPVDYSDDEVNNDTWRFNARVALNGVRMGGGEVSIALWGRNLGDSDKPVNMNTLGPVVAGQYEFPRTYGIDITYEYY